mmetsp:Transcript_70163/g.86093  ORF Transcript_70163/g.86093 Transcript_70163/m.86093 type:complete len:226 (+) Transcript_70163:3-680(+)
MIEDIIATLFVAQDTTASTAQYGLYLLCIHDNLQEILYNELNTAFKDKKFDFKKLNKLHYFRAFIYDITRIASTAPQGLPRTATKDIKITLSDKKDYYIRKNDVIHLNSIYINLIEWKKLYYNPTLKNKLIFGSTIYDTLYLNAWLNNKNEFISNNNNASFGFGNRNCAGKMLSIKELMVLFGELIPKYTFMAPNNDKTKIDLINKNFGSATDLQNPCGIKINKR